MDPTGKKIMRGKKSNLAGLLQPGFPPHQQQQQLPPFQDLTASTAGKKGHAVEAAKGLLRLKSAKRNLHLRIPFPLFAPLFSSRTSRVSKSFPEGRMG